MRRQTHICASRPIQREMEDRLAGKGGFYRHVEGRRLLLRLESCTVNCLITTRITSHNYFFMCCKNGSFVIKVCSSVQFQQYETCHVKIRCYSNHLFWFELINKRFLKKEINIFFFLINDFKYVSKWIVYGDSYNHLIHFQKQSTNLSYLSGAYKQSAVRMTIKQNWLKLTIPLN